MNKAKARMFSSSRYASVTRSKRFTNKNSKPNPMQALVQRVAFLVFALGFAPSVLANTLSFGPYNQGVYSGTPPFNTTGTCADAGDDCSDSDTRIRSADIISFAWSIAASDIPAGNPDFTSVILEQTLIPTANASIIFDEIPTICLAPPQGTGGTNPSSSITENPDGSKTLVCNLGNMGNGDQKSFTVPVRPLANSYNGSTFTTTQLVYALDASGAKIVADTGYTDTATYEITAAPAWDLIGDRQSIYEAGITTFDMGSGRGPERGFFVYQTVHLGADAERAGKGVSALTDSFDFNPLVTSTESDGVTPFPLEYSIIECTPNSSGWGYTVWGNEAIRTDRDLGEHVVDSGTCEIGGDSISGWTLTAKDVNTLGSRYPTKTVNGTSLAAGPYFQMAYRIRLFVPFSQVEVEDTTPNSGAVNITSCMSDFDPVDFSGISNYTTGLEPGHNGTAMPDGSKSNNCSGPLTLEIRSNGSYSNYTADHTDNNGGLHYQPLLSYGHAGDGIVEPTVAYVNSTNVSNNGSLSLSNVSVCTKFDNTTQKLTDRGDVGASAGTYAFMTAYYGSTASEWKIEYASVPFPDVDPLDKDDDGISDFNSMSGRYEGNWDQMRDYHCEDPAVTWSEDPTVIGVDNVNVLRVTPATPSITLDAGEYIRLLIPLVARDTFNGGKYANQAIPVGATLPQFATWRSDEYQTTYRNTSYWPAPENSSGDGDRVTLTRIQIDVAKSTVTPEASAGTATSTLAGNTVAWKLEPSISSVLTEGGTAVNVVVTDVLPSTLAYDHACTIEHAEGVAPTSVEYNTPSTGETTLIWTLGNPHSLTPITPIVFCTLSDATATAGTAAINVAYINADNAVQSTPAKQTITLGQAGSVQAASTVDVPTDLINDEQLHTLKWFNFSNAGLVSAPTMINVLPHIGDDSSGSARAPASNFSGTIVLKAEPTITWTDGSLPSAGDTHATLGTFYYSADTATSINHDPDANSSNWCEYNGTSFVNPSVAGGICPANFAAVTAIKHVANYDLEVNGNPRQGLVMNYSLQADSNKSADRYVNIFGLDSSSLPAAQYVVSKRGVVRIAAHSIGDFVFTDINENGVYDAAIDLPVPDGVTVELYDFNSNTLLVSTTTIDGTYLFDQLEPGDYYVRIPETLFSASGLLNGWTAASNPQAANNDSNQEVDHNSFVTSHTDSIGVQSDLITLSSTPGLSGAAPTGDEPTNDNVIPIADYNTNDDFSNLTVDLALVSADSDNDGMLDVYEFGPEGIVIPLDTDGDGIPDYLDVDSDNDNVPDAIEFGDNPAAPVDTDGDGAYDHLDIDSDNDGLKDSDESQIDAADSDNDGITDAFDVDVTGGADSNGNGIDDAVEAAGLIDTDGDGILDIHDLDSDNDGLTDAYESSATGNNVDADGDGIVDGFTDANGDGMDDGVFATPQPDNDTDSDGKVDHLDTDSDNDGITDATEAGGIDANGDGVIDGFTDANGDGIDDDTVATPLSDPNLDGDTLANHLDVDSDNDGIPDAVEGNVDSDSDGIADYLDTDSDNDGIPDALEAPISGVDTDGDGIDDIYDVDATGGTDANNDGVDDAVTVLDTDNDGIADYLDLDTDNDGLADSAEVPLAGTDSDNDGIDDIFDVDETSGIDANNNGVDDAFEANGLLDTDGDGNPDFRDLDSDNDGLNDVVEAGGTDANNDGVIDDFTDANNDGFNDTTATTALADPDTDGDGTPDHLDVDSDNDGIPDAIESAGAAGNGDSDGDGISDHLDLDSDNDGVSDAVEAPGSGAGGSVSDADNDGIDDQYDVDATGGVDANEDGIDDAVFAEGVLDTDGDGAADYLDLDSDGDNINDIEEASTAGGAVVDANNDGVVDNFTDANGDGIDDNAGTTALPDTDSDGDGTPNRLEIDSDGDGIPDVVESGSGATPLDTDGDGVPDYLDLDSDNDGISDAIETGTGVDSDGDGIDDLYDVDSTGGTDADNDGIDDVGQSVDTDGDGIEDHLDLDSDNDGLTDTFEAGGTDANGDGIVDSFTDSNNNGIDDAIELAALPIDDSDGDGIPDYLDTDSDGDGIPDTIESQGYPGSVDTDSDGKPDHLDTDSDDDGIDDSIEAQVSGNDTDGDGIDDLYDVDQTGGSDIDNDGVDDAIEAVGTTDTDGDGTPDALELDSDNDGIPDSVEAGTGSTPIDTDSDGTPDYLDTDSDNDGVPDTIEAQGLAGTVDTDGDGTPDHLDTDSDDDGISDTIETQLSGTDTDGDGIDDTYDVDETGGTDADNDGVDDAIEATGTTDTDGDGTPDALELDSDNDGIPDSVETGTGSTPIDTDSDGTPDYLDTDSDNDGVPDTIESQGYPGTVDTDGDGTPDHLDTDSDDDGISDTIEAQATGNDSDADGIDDAFDPDVTGGSDIDNDGVDDVIEASGTVDTDGDGVPDALELDSDDDGVPDAEEAGAGSTPVDTDGDGVADFLDTDSDDDGVADGLEDATGDTDGDGIIDRLDPDSDNDGIPDSVEAPDGASPVDSDGDGTPDFLDTDSDNDGIPDAIEAQGTEGVIDTDSDGVPDHLDTDSDGDGVDDSIEAQVSGTDTDGDGIDDLYDVDETGGTDADNDGVDDAVEAAGTTDTDGDGTPDALELDSDNDGIPDSVEAGLGATPVDTDNDGIPDYLDTDSDNDGIPDAIESQGYEGTVDTDADGIPDHLDTDSDNDGIEDTIEAQVSGIDSDGDGIDDSFDADATGGSDIDNDGVDDALEASGTVDTDGDGTPDSLDLDSDDDGVPDSVESGVETGTTPIDTDGDGIPDFLDADSDDDGISDSLEDTGGDTDEDGIPDRLDADSDNDGIPDVVEAGTGDTPVDTDGDGTPDYLDTDSDNDGIDDAVEGEGGATPGSIDTDGDGIPDYRDLDSDGDGLPDSEESGNTDTDEDGVADYRDLDSDNDGLNDVVEAGGEDADNDGMIDNPVDENGDGLDDEVAETPLTESDSDGDGVVDHLDTDSDNDGIPDAVEAGGEPTGVDTDGDGTPDYIDTDADGDNVPDAIEASGTPGDVDTDDDGTPDYLDVDSDNDGIDDTFEVQASGVDTDGDGIDDTFDVDSTGGEDADNDGVDDAIETEGTKDSDGDGVPDMLDLDSDNDGIPDAIEIGNRETPVDTDGDGTPDYLDTDSDNDGLPDEDEAGDGNAPIDTDGDGTPDYLDTDSDNDGESDTDEAGDTTPDTDSDGTPNHLDVDSDNDGIPDAVENATAGNGGDSDNDGVEDYLDTDSDNDGVSDTIEAGHSNEDSDGDGIVDDYDVSQTGGSDNNNDGVDDMIAMLDTDQDGEPDHLDLDSDNDGIDDEFEADNSDTDNDGVPDRLDNDADNDQLSDVIEGSGDTDGDGTPDYLDLDSDNDGIPDATEASFEGEIPADRDADGTPDYIDVDADNDGISDAYEGSSDSDGDGVEDFRDLDVDNDGIFDIIEVRIGMDGVYALDENLDGVIDFSNPYGANGMADIVETVPESGIENYPFPDIDGDGVIDYNDLDSDNDGLLDTFESDHVDDDFNGIIDAYTNQASVFDDGAQPWFALVVDEVGLAEGAGGAPRNTDNDGLADFRDPDSDNDGIMDIVEGFGPLADVDKDGAYDGFIDENGDGISDIWQNNIAPVDTDKDGIVDAIETDSDGDGISDVIESGGIDADGDGIIDGFIDENGDGVDDRISAVGGVLIDTDKDGIPDFQDIDSDGDGLSDMQEAGGNDVNGDGVADEPVLAAAIIDSNLDGVPDHLQAGSGGRIHTGLEGSGCSVLASNGSNAKRIDPTLLLMLLMAAVVLAVRFVKRTNTRGAHAARTAGVVAMSSAMLLGCASHNGPDVDNMTGERQLEHHFYAATGLGLSWLNPDTSEVEGWDVNDRVNNGGQLTFGVDVNKHLSLEIHSADLGSAGLSPVDRINYQLHGGSALYYFGKNRSRYRRQGLSAYGRFGLGVLENSSVNGVAPYVKDNATHMLFGAGLEYDTRIGLGLRAEYIAYEKDVRYGQLALIYRTGKRQKRAPVFVAAQPSQPVMPPLAAVAVGPIDHDNDGVLTTVDQCPNTPVGVQVDATGCALFNGVIEGVNFKNNSSYLTDNAREILNDVAITLKKFPSVRVDVKAHTDSAGEVDYNQGLSERRAQSVVEYLNLRGVELDRMEPSAYGELKPIDTNSTGEGRARNRRVELFSKKGVVK